ncbi:hypothetical protein MTP99_000131 [Tenebrio molitor]|jgi:hypothetical protein|nr:hypothetical protein MTP99_000131 [Tenebrio molitor]
MNYIINKVQHFVGVDPFLRPSVVEEQFRILYLVSGDSSDLCFPLVGDASDVDVTQSVFVSSENSVFAAQCTCRFFASEIHWKKRDRTESVQIFLKTYQELSLKTHLNVFFYLPGSFDRGSNFLFSLVNRGHYQALILDLSLTDVNALAVDVHTSRNRIFRD